MKCAFLLACVVGLFVSDIAANISELRNAEISSRKQTTTQEKGGTYVFYQHPQYPRDCSEVYNQCEGRSPDGVYLIKPEDFLKPFEVFCNNSIDGGGWTVFQRRLDGSVDFNRSWTEYKNGFGFLRREFWLGNGKIAYLTNQKTYELRIDLNNVNGEPYFAKYNLFRISDERTKYRLVGLGNYNSNSTTTYDAMDTSRNQYFTTYDQENDAHTDFHCARLHHGGWWYYMCSQARLNSLYQSKSAPDITIVWANLPGGRNQLKYTEMKIRPLT
ncbi:Fibrinogen-like protein A [Holothuria leucospilota]|uniref:Fibrinogen-like protein A n=1 Tax=Holothuria leucospilota TaxID=206669 RepID=A0A9Q1BP00_HOLLE|nr:Fibrinogen-like protein A [Holothuria leucospilota]